MIAEVMCYTPDPTIANYWNSFAQKFVAAFKACYCTEDFTPYMHVFSTHVEYWLKEHGNIESFANYDIESKNSINKTVVRHASDRYGGENRAKNNIPLQQLQREYRDSQQLFIIPEPTKTTINTKRRKSRKKDAQNTSKRQRTTKANWVSKSAPKIASASFDNVQTEVYKETLVDIMEEGKRFGVEFETKVFEVTSALDLEVTQKILRDNCNNFEKYILDCINAYHGN